MRRRFVLPSLVILIVLAVVVGAGFLASAAGWIPLPGAEESGAAAIPARTGELQAVVRARGELQAVNAYPVAVPPVPTGALKVAKLVDEGSTVKKGDTLIVFDETQLDIELDNNMATFRSTERQIDRNRIQSGIEFGSIGVFKTVAELELEASDAVRIDDEEIFSRKEILDAALDKDYATKKIVFADMSLLLRGKYYDIDEGILQVQKNQVAGKIERVRTSLATLVLKSPGDGMVVYRKNWRGGTVTVGASVWPGNVLMQLVDPSETALKVYVPEKYAAGLEEGLEATVRVDAFAGRTYPGKVTTVSKLSRPISQESPVKYFEAEIGLSEPDPERLRPGMGGEAEIRLGGSGGPVLIIPRAAVHGEGDDTWVTVETPGGARERREIAIGAGDLVRVAVESGLAEGERVLLEDPGAMVPATAPGEEEGEGTGRPTGGRPATAGAAG